MQRRLCKLVLVAAIVLGGLGFVELSAQPAAAADSSPPADTCIVEFLLPDDAELFVAGKSFGTKRRLTYRQLKPGQRFEIEALARFAGGGEAQRNLFVEPGRLIRVAMLDPNARSTPILLQHGHTDLVNSVRLSADGKLAVSASADRTAVVWDVETRHVLRVLGPSEASLLSADITPDGKQVVTAAWNGTVLVWDVMSGEVTGRLEGAGANPFDVVLSNDGRLVLSSASDGTAVLWDIRSGRKLRSFQMAAGRCFAAVFSPDDRLILAGGGRFSDEEGGALAQAELWDVESGRTVRTIQTPLEAIIKAVAFSPDGAEVFLGSLEGTGVLLETATGKQQQTFRGHQGQIIGAAFSPSGKQILTGGGKANESAEVFLWDRNTGQIDRRYEAHDDIVTSVAMHPDGRRFLTGSNDHLVIKWNLADGGWQNLCATGCGEIQSTLLTADRQAVLALSVYGDFAAVWEASTGRPHRQFPHPDTWLNSAALSPDTRLVAAGGNGVAIIWDRFTGETVSRWEGLQTAIRSIAFSPDGKLIATGGAVPAEPPEEKNAELVLWDVETGQQVRRFDGNLNVITSISFSPNGEWLVTSSDDHSATIRNVATGEVLYDLVRDCDVKCAALSPDGKSILVGLEDAKALLLDLASGEIRHQLAGHREEVHAVAFSPDSRYAVTGSWDERAILWDLSSGKRLRDWSSGAQVSWLGFTPDGCRVLAGCGDGRCVLWDVATGDELGRLVLFDNGLEWVCLTPEGLFDCSYGGRAVIGWPVDGKLEIEGLDTLKHPHEQPGLWPLLLAGERPLPDFGPKSPLPSAAAFVAVEPPADDALSIVAEDRCLLEIDLPGADQVTLDGRALKPAGHFELRGLAPRRLYEVDLEIRYDRIEPRHRTLLLEGGRRVRVALADPRATRPSMVLQAGHRGPLNMARFSPDGKWIATTSSDNTTMLWDAATGQTLRVFGGHVNFVMDALFSPDGHRLLTTSLDAKTILFDIASGEALRTLEGHTGWGTCADISRDGKLIATGADDGTAVIWDAATGQQLRRVVPPVGEVWSVAFSPDGKLLATAGGTWQREGKKDPTFEHVGELVLWDISTGEMLRQFEGHHKVLCSVQFSPDGRWLVSSSEDGTSIIWNVATGDVRHRLHALRGMVYAATFSPDGRLVATGGGVEHDDETPPGEARAELVIWDATTGQRVRELVGHRDTIDGVDFSPDGKRLVSASHDSSALVWDVASGKQLARLAGYGGRVDAVLLGPNRLDMLMIEPDGRAARFWDAVTGQSQRTAVTPHAAIFSLATFGEAQQLLVGSGDGTATLWDINQDAPLRSLTGHEGVVQAVAFTPDGRLAATAGGRARDDEGTPIGEVFLWEPATGRRLHRLSGHRAAVFAVAFSPDGRYLASGGDDETVLVWEAASGKLLHRLEGHGDHVTCLAFSPDGKVLLSGANDGTAATWDVQSGRKLHSLNSHFHEWSIHCAAFDPRGRTALTGSTDATAILWDVQSGRVLRVFEEEDQVSFVGFSSDGTRVVTGMWGARNTIWDVATGAQLARLVLVNEGQDWLAITPEGLFDGSQQGRQYVSWRIGEALSLVPVDRFFQDFYRPGLLSELLLGMQPLPEVELGQSLPPKLRIVSPVAGPATANTLTIEVDVVDGGGGIGRVALYQNDARLLTQGETQQLDGATRKSFPVALIEGENRFRVTATSADGSWESEPAEVVLYYEKPLPKSDLYVVAVGVNQYADANLRLQYAAGDARSFAELFVRRGAQLYENVHVTTLLDGEATRERIRAALAEVASATRPQDTMVVFLAGHGIMVGQRYYFVPQEFRRQAAQLNDDLREQGFPADELADQLASAAALKRLLILDTCASGGALGTVTRGRSGFALRGAIERLARTQGVFTIAASAATEEAQESRELGHGVLTYTLLAALGAVREGPLAGQRITPNVQEPVIDVLQWFSYAAGRVPQLTEHLYGAAQDIHTSTQGTSFPVLPLVD